MVPEYVRILQELVRKRKRKRVILSSLQGPRHGPLRARPRRSREERREAGLRGFSGPVRPRPVRALRGTPLNLAQNYRVILVASKKVLLIIL